MNKAHILMLTPAFPWPANTGGLVRIAEVFKGLRRHFRVTLIAPGQCNIPSDLIDANSEIRIVTPPSNRRLSTLPKMLLSRKPYHAMLYRSESMVRAVASCLENERIDLIYCHFIYTSEYLPPSTRIPVCLDSHNVDRQYWGSKAQSSTGFKRWITRINARRVQQYETALLPRFNAYVCVSTEDSDITRQYACPPVQHILTAPNGVDLNYYSPRHFAANRSLTLGFLGSLDVGMNVASVRHFYINTWPRIRSVIKPTPRLLLIGRNPAASLTQLMGKDSNVHFTGTVADVRPWLEQTDIFVAPLIEGAGTKLKTLEAMAMGLPIVGTPLAFQGLGGAHGLEYLVADSDEKFTQGIAMLEKAPDRRAAMGYAARSFVKERFGWDSITDRLAMDLSASFRL